MKVSFSRFTELILDKAGTDTASRLDVVASLISPKTPTPEGLVTALASIAVSKAEEPEMRARALRLILRSGEKNFVVTRDAFLPLALGEQQGPLAAVWEEFTRDTRLARRVNDFARFAQSDDPAKRALAATVLVNISSSTVLRDRRAKDAAHDAIDRLWETPAQAASLMEVIGRTRSTQFASQLRERLKDPNVVVAKAAETALAKLGLQKDTSAPTPLIAEMNYDEVLKIAIATRGNSELGQQLFTQQGCILCHTVSDKEPPKGPMLGGIGKRYSRAELCESILKPSAKIAQGFESQSFQMKNGDQFDGFVVKEGGDSVEVRNLVGTTTILEKADIVRRQKLDQSIMPEGIVANLTPTDLASLIAFLESTSGAAAK